MQQTNFKAELVLTELENISKWEHSKKSGSGLFTIIKEATYGRAETDEIISLRATIILSFGYAMFYCPIDLVVQRLEKTVLPFLRQYLASVKPETVIKEAHLDTINLIANTVHPSRLGTDYKFESRFECLSYIKQYIKAESPESLSTWVRLLGAKAAASLAKLDPPLSDNEVWDIGNVLTKIIFPICREKSGLKTPQVEHDFSQDPDMHTTCSYRTSTAKSLRRSDSASSGSSLNSNHGGGISGNSSALETFNFFIDNEESTMMDATISQYRSAICQIVLKRPGEHLKLGCLQKALVVQTVSQLLKMFQTFYGSSLDHERIRSTETTVLILQVYLNNATDTKLGHATPRLADSVGSVRNAAIKSIWLAFRLSLLHGGHSPLEPDILDAKLFDLNSFVSQHLSAEGRMDSQVRHFEVAQEHLSIMRIPFSTQNIKIITYHHISRNAITAIAKEIESRLPQSQVQTYLSVLIKMLVEEQNNVGSGAAQLLAAMLKNRGHMLHVEADLIFKTILENLPRVHPVDMIYKNLLNAFKAFASHQQITAVDALLHQPLPYSVQVKDVWKDLSQESGQFYLIADYLLDLFGFPQTADTDSVDQLSVDSHTSSTNPSKNFFEILDTGGGSSIKLVSSYLCSLLAALNEIILNGEPEVAIAVRTPSFLASLFVSLTAVIDAQYPSVSKEQNTFVPRTSVITGELCRLTQIPANLVIEALRSLVHRLQMHSVVETMNSSRSWTNLANTQHYLSAITTFSRAFCDGAPDLTLGLMRLLLERIKPEHTDTDRIAAAAVLSSLITRCPNRDGEFDLDLLKTTFETLSAALSDSNLIVKKLALRGFSCTGALVDIYNQSERDESELFEELSNRAANAAVGALDDASDRNDQLSVEAVNTLESLVFALKKPILEEIMPRLLMKIRPCFEKENMARVVAFSLFGKLSLRVGHTDIFRESLHSNIISVLLHLDDSDNEVKAICAQALKNFEPAFTSPQIIALIQNELVSDGPKGEYISFLKDFSTILIVSYPDRANYYVLNSANYFKSQSPVIRANAAHMAGFLIEALTPDLRQTISKDILFSENRFNNIHTTYNIQRRTVLMEQAFLSQQHKTRSYELFSGFLKLLSDNDSKVKYAAATAIISMSEFADEDVNQQQ